MEWKKFIGYVNQISYLTRFGWEFSGYTTDRLEFKNQKYGSVVVQNEQQLNEFLEIYSKETAKK